MTNLRLLVLTDHSKHSAENSLYAIVRSFHRLGKFSVIDIASRGNPGNKAALTDLTETKIYVHSSGPDFEYASANADIEKNLHQSDLAAYDFILLRIPRPLPDGFFRHLTSSLPANRIFNNPNGIEKTSSKGYLVNFPELTPPLKLCHNKEEVFAFAKAYDTVIKPLRDYGGHGIMRINENGYLEGNYRISRDEFVKKLNTIGFPLLAMKFMKNVKNGDKRIVVAGGKILLASLRMPAEGSWMCNVAQGATAEPSEPTERERYMVEMLDKKLSKEGIILYGIDTLEDDDGLRYLSEINTLSIGGIGPAEKMLNLPITDTVVAEMWKAMEKVLITKN